MSRKNPHQPQERLTKKQRLRAKRLAQQEPAARQPWWQRPSVVGAAAAVVVIAVVVFFIVSSHTAAPGAQTACSPQTLPAAPPSTAQAQSFGTAPPAVQTAVTEPQPSVLAAVGSGGQPGNLNRICAGTVLTGANGRPAVVYVGAEFCPYCAAERWVIAMSIARFGTVSNLQLMKSSPTDVYPSTNTFTFHGTGYASSDIDFQAAELEDRNQQPFETPSAALSKLFAQIDQPPYTAGAGSFPFLDIGGRFTLNATSFSPQLLQGLSWSQIAGDLSDASSPVTQAIMGNANIVTAAICISTNNQPQSACSSTTIRNIEKTLNAQPLVG